MMFEMPQYEVRYYEKAEWEQISEINLLQKLHETYDRVTPGSNLTNDSRRTCDDARRCLPAQRS